MGDHAIVVHRGINCALCDAVSYIYVTSAKSALLADSLDVDGLALAHAPPAAHHDVRRDGPPRVQGEGLLPRLL